MNKLVEQFMNTDTVLVGVNYTHNTLSKLEALVRSKDEGYYSFHFNGDIICDGEIYTDIDIRDYVKMTPIEAYNILKDHYYMITIRNEFQNNMSKYFKDVKIDINTSIGLINIVD